MEQNNIKELREQQLESVTGGDQETYEIYVWMMTRFRDFRLSTETKLQMLDEAYDTALTDGSLTQVELSKLEDIYIQELMYYKSL